MLQAQIGGLNEEEFASNNEKATQNILNAFKQYDVQRLVHISSSVVNSVAEEIGDEFGAGNPESKSVASADAQAAELPEAGSPLETVARVMFDKANIQQRIASLERAVDALGHSLKPDVAELKDEVAYLRLLLEEVLDEIREQAGKGKKSA